MEALDRDHLNLRLEKPIVDLLKNGKIPYSFFNKTFH